MKYPKYERYKDSGSKYINELPDYWITSAIKYLVSTPITDGPHETPDFLEDGIPFISAEAIENGRINFNKKRDCISEEQHKIYSKKYKPQRNDVYVVKSGSTTGKVAIVDTDEEFNIWSPLAAIRVNPEENDPYFLFYALSSDLFQKQVSLFWSFGTQPNIGMSVLQKLKIPTPPLKEQQSIANFLDKEATRLDALISKKQQLIETLKEKRIAVISQAVTKGLNPEVPTKDSGIEWLGEVPKHWEVKKLKFSVKLINQKIETVEDTDDSNSKYVGLENVIPFKGQITFNGDSYIPEGISNSFKIGDVLFGKLRPYLAKAFVADINGICSSELLVFRPDRILSNEFLLLLVLSDGFLKLVNSSTYGSKMPRASWDFIGNIPITLPKIDEQLEIVKKTKEELMLIDSILTKTEDAINKLQEFKTALISAAVTGKIKVPEQA